MTRLIRPAQRTDAAEMARLLTLLGHPTTEDEVAARWGDFQTEANIALVAQREDGTLCGLATLHKMIVLHRPHPVGRITALVVDEALRGKGIGQQLVAAAEDCLKNAGCGLLEITSNQQRVAAHQFYRHLNYQQTSMRFAKQLIETN